MTIVILIFIAPVMAQTATPTPSTTPYTEGYYEFEAQTAPNIALVGTGWSTAADGLGRTHLQTTNQSGTVSFRFTGEWLIIYRAPNPSVADKALTVCVNTTCQTLTALPLGSVPVPVAFRGVANSTNNVWLSYPAGTGVTRLDSFVVLNGSIITIATPTPITIYPTPTAISSSTPYTPYPSPTAISSSTPYTPYPTPTEISGFGATLAPQVIYVPYIATPDYSQTVTFDNNGTTYTGRVDNSVTAGEAMIAIVLLGLLVSVLAQLVIGLWKR